MYVGHKAGMSATVQEDDLNAAIDMGTEEMAQDLIGAEVFLVAPQDLHTAPDMTETIEEQPCKHMYVCKQISLPFCKVPMYVRTYVIIQIYICMCVIAYLRTHIRMSSFYPPKILPTRKKFS